MRAILTTCATLLAGFLLGCGQDTFANSEDDAGADAMDDVAMNDVIVGGDSAADANGPDACGNPQTDPLNCGACAHSCLGGDCDAGTCMPTTLAKNQGAPYFIATDDAGLYWTIPDNDGGVVRADKNGGGQAFLVAHTFATSIAVSDGNVYYGGINTIGVVQTNGVVPTSSVTADISTADIAADMHVFAAGTTGVSRRDPLLTGLIVSSQSGGAHGIAFDATRVYFSVGTDTIRSLDKALSGPSLLSLGGQSTPDGVAVDDLNVFWTNNGDGTVHRADKNLSGTVAIANTQTSPRRLAIDAKYVYWVNGNGTIMRAGKDGSVAVPPVFLFSGPPGPRGIALDDDAVYWTNETAGTVMKLAKPAN